MNNLFNKIPIILYFFYNLLQFSAKHSIKLLNTFLYKLIIFIFTYNYVYLFSILVVYHFLNVVYNYLQYF